MRKVIIVIDKIEDDTDYNNKPYKKVTDKEGNEWKVKQGRGGKLKDKWDILKEDLAYELSIDKYEGKDFVADFELVKDELKQEAAKEVAEKSLGIAPQEKGMKSDRERAFALSYAKDLAVTETIQTSEIIEWADKFYKWLTK